MAFLEEKDREAVRRRLAGMKEPVRLVYFTQELECPTCRETRQLLEEVTSLSDKLRLEVHDFLLEREEAARHGVDKIPATVLVGDSDPGIRFYGIPVGYEFATLLEDILMVSARDSGLAPATRQALRALEQPLHLQVFVTPT